MDALVLVMADVTQYPDDPLRTYPAGQPDERWAPFGGAGLVTWEIDEARGSSW